MDESNETQDEKDGVSKKEMETLSVVKIQKQKGYRIKTVHWSDVAGAENRDRGEGCCADCRCCTGCHWMLLAALYFFIIIPGGIFSLMHGINRGNNITLGVGIGILVLFVLLAPVLCVTVRHCYREYQEKNEKYSVSTPRDYDNPQFVGDNT